MLRPLAFLLVLGNIVLFALAAGGGGEADGRTGEPRQPLSPDRIRIVSRGDPPPITETPKQCLQWLDLTRERLAVIEQFAAGHKSLALAHEQTQDETVFYRLLIPIPSGGKAAAVKKGAELNSLGIKKFEIQAEADDRAEIVLGVFDQDEEATRALDSLKKTGVRSATIQPVVDRPALFRVRLSGPSSAVALSRQINSLPSADACREEKAASLAPPPTTTGGS